MLLIESIMEPIKTRSFFSGQIQFKRPTLLETIGREGTGGRISLGGNFMFLLERIR